MAVIESVGLSKTYGSKPAVVNLSFRVNPGSVTGFLGPNGAGKSTTMRLMVGLDNGSGTTTFDGMPFRRLTHPMRHVGVQLEAKPFHPTRKARNHLRMLAGANGIPDGRVDEVLGLVGLLSEAGHKPGKFSLGMGQRLGIAAALLGDPHTLILDEPANGLDPQGINWLRNLLKQLASEGRSIFVSSHLLSEMALLADQLVVIGRGQLITSGPIRDFITSSARTSVIVRTPDMSLLGPALAERGGHAIGTDDGSFSVTGIGQTEVGDVAHSVGARIHELRTREATLEEAFLDATGMAAEFVAHTPPHDAGQFGPPGAGYSGQPPGPWQPPGPAPWQPPGQDPYGPGGAR
ncbi:MAG TPA: ATP-binding cassette domain-containing protein [Nocardioidaceae bacterium]|nr:ATP-binding cassette domain-containing protein [Nocardioidaceae bacterium]